LAQREEGSGENISNLVEEFFNVDPDVFKGIQ